MSDKHGPLEGVKVIELGSWIAVPGATAILGDWGAQIIKVENIRGGDLLRGLTQVENIKIRDSDVNAFFVMINRNKRSIAIDIKKEQGREILAKLLERADVFLTNIEQGELEKRGLTYQNLTNLNRKLIYLHFTGYGEGGPDKDKPGYDIMAFWTRGGFMNKLMEPGKAPPAQPQALGDMTSAGFIAGAVSTALFAREKTGKGQKVEMSLYQNAAWCLGTEIELFLGAGKELRPIRQDGVLNPLWNVYQTRDGRWIYLACLQSDLYWHPLCEAIGREDLKADPRFNSMEKRTENNKALISLLDEAFSQKDAVEWEEVLRRYSIMFEKVRSIMEVARDPQAIENEFFGEIEHAPGKRITVINSPVKFSDTHSAIRGSAPEFAQHTEEILLELDYTWDDIVQLKSQEVIP